MADAFEKVGKDGVITVEEGKTSETTLEFVEGMQFDKGYISPYFVNHPDLKCEMEDALILIYEKKLVQRPRHAAAAARRSPRRGKPLLIIAEDVESEALAVLVVNRLQAGFPVCAVKAPGFGDRRKAMLGDIAILTGGTFISEDLGIKLENVTLDQLGKAKQVDRREGKHARSSTARATRRSIQERIDQIRTQMDQTESEYDKEKFSERLAKLTGGVAIIRVGAATEAEMKQTKGRVEDALHATRAAVAEGHRPRRRHGPAALPSKVARRWPRSSKATRSSAPRSWPAPWRSRSAPSPRTAAQDGAVVADEVRLRGEKNPNIGYQCQHGRIRRHVQGRHRRPDQGDPLAPCKTRASIAGLMLTTEVMVTKIDEDEKKSKVAGAVA